MSACALALPLLGFQADPVVYRHFGAILGHEVARIATELGIVVTNCPDFCLEEVSDHTMALLLACARRIPKYNRLVHEGSWDVKAGHPLPRLRGQTLGLIGFGNTAHALVPKAAGFGLKIIAYARRQAAMEADPAVTVTNDLGFLLKESDYVSLHLPSTPETRHLMDAHALRQMKPSLQAGRYGDALLAASQSLAEQIAKAKNVTIPEAGIPRVASRPGPSHVDIPWPVIIFGIFLLFWIFGRGGGGRRGGYGGGGGGFLPGLILGNVLGGGRSWGGSSGSSGGGFGGYDSGGGGFGGFGGGDSGGGGASGSW